MEIRYHIKTLLVEDYGVIRDVLRDIIIIRINTMFLSPVRIETMMKKLRDISRFCNKLTNSLYKENLRIINGYGYKIGYYIAAAATRLMLEENVASFEKYLLMYPFDEHLTQSQNINIENLWFQRQM